VLRILTYRDEDEAVAIADSDYGLASYVFSSDPIHARAIAARLQTCRVTINGAPNDANRKRLTPLAAVQGARFDCAVSHRSLRKRSISCVR